MSATLTGPIVIENVRPVVGSQRCVRGLILASAFASFLDDRRRRRRQRGKAGRRAAAPAAVPQSRIETWMALQREVSVETAAATATRTGCAKGGRDVHFPEESEVVHRNVDVSDSASPVLDVDAGDETFGGHEGDLGGHRLFGPVSCPIKVRRDTL
jgi:hypothetical protein